MKNNEVYRVWANRFPSNYWTANLFFKAQNNTYKRVPQMVNLGLQGREGVTVYYIPPYDGKTKVTAFPKVS